MGKWTDRDTSSYSGDSMKDVARAEHTARDDAEKSGVFERGNSSKNSERFSRTDAAGQRAESFWESIFGKSEKTEKIEKPGKAGKK